MNRIIKSITLTIIFLAILIYALFAPMDKTAMKRESGPIVAPVARALTLEEALDLSLSLGDGRQVNFAPFGLGWEG